MLMVRELDSGGIERDVTKLAIGLDRRRFTPYVVTYANAGLRHNDLVNAGVPIVSLRVSSLKSPTTLLAVLKLSRFIIREKIRVLHAFDSSGIFGIPLARTLGVDVILTSTLGHRDLLDRKTRKQFKLIDRLADAIVVNCEAMRKHLTDDFSVPSNRIELCYNGVDTTEFYPSTAPKPISVAGASIVIGSICVLRPEKALEILQEAFAKILPLAPDAKLLIVGNGPELQKLKANSKRLGIEEASLFMPAVSAVAPLMRSIDIFVSCSHSEAFSNSILEAMACGCCVVASRVGGTPELIEDQERGLLFTPGNVEELAQSLVRLLSDVGLRKELGQNAAQFAVKNLSIEIAVERTSDIYQKLLQRNSR
jgi:glycosyltransferase involved in cell wall biosynthesis